jgi:hypothetical protein
MDGASVSEWVSEWVSAGLLFAKAIKELTYKHLGQGTMSKSCKFLCAWNHWWWKDNEVCTYLLYKSLGNLIVKSWSPKRMGFFNHKTEKRVRTHLIQRTQWMDPRLKQKTMDGLTLYWLPHTNQSQSELCSIILWTNSTHCPATSLPWLMILNSDPLPGFLEREKEHNCLLNNCKLNPLSVFFFFFGLNTVVPGPVWH